LAPEGEQELIGVATSDGVRPEEGPHVSLHIDWQVAKPRPPIELRER
jgi:hypothetical protein